jgi:hypothetical protein
LHSPVAVRDSNRYEPQSQASCFPTSRNPSVQHQQLVQRLVCTYLCFVLKKAKKHEMILLFDLFYKRGKKAQISTNKHLDELLMAIPMFLNRHPRALSAFQTATQRWAAIPLRDPHDSITQTPSSDPADVIGRQRLTLTSWNIQASQFGHVARSRLILDHILKGPKVSDIIHLQEVTLASGNLSSKIPEYALAF